MTGNITRLVKFLNNLNYTPTTISRNHSYYFNIKGTKVRISDHLPGIKSCDWICILVPTRGSGFSLFIDKSLYVIPSLKEMKLFLYHLIILNEGNFLSKYRKFTWNTADINIAYKNLKQKHKYLKKTFGQNVANLVKKNNNLKETNKQLNAEIVKLRNKIKLLQQNMAVDVQNVKE